MERTTQTVAVAESCTGGLLAAELATTPGSGDWFIGGVVAYHERVKFRLLAVPEGPVISGEAAIAMARGVRTLLDTDIGIAITGVAGPNTEEDQPVGTVFIGICHHDQSRSVPLVIEGDPDRIRSVAVERALAELTTTAPDIDLAVPANPA